MIAGILKNIAFNIILLKQQYDTPPIWVLLLEHLVDYEREKLNREKISYKPVDNAIKAFQRQLDK